MGDSYKNTHKKEYTVLLAGNPNVGKSTVFNALTGMNQHTGNWTGKTVSSAKGKFHHKDKCFEITDLPGTYSLICNSAEEEVARDYICFEEYDLCVMVIDATCIERNLNLILQILEITKKGLLCVNLMDEAKRKNIEVDLDELSIQLGIPVVATSASSGYGLENLKDEIYNMIVNSQKTFRVKIDYDEDVKRGISELKSEVEKINISEMSSDWLCLRLLENDEGFTEKLSEYLKFDFKSEYIQKLIRKAGESIYLSNVDLCDKAAISAVKRSEKIAKLSVRIRDKSYNKRDRKIDKILTSKITGIPIMIGLMGVIFWITIVGANYPSQLLSDFFAYIRDYLEIFMNSLNTAEWLENLLLDGVYKTLTWVVAVMLPPMAIFFPLFTILEDLGYLPRIAFNMDKCFKNAGVHGKQALTMCMGFGCNACGVVGCRIIDSPRERLIAIITNNFVPCNGRFPTLITIITMFFAVYCAGQGQSVVSTLILIAVIILGVMVTLFVSKFLSNTLLKGLPSSFTLELPPYRKVKLGKVIVRSIFDRTLFVLRRAVCISIPAGALIWILANTYVGDISLLQCFANFLDPFARIVGMDGIILTAFILGFPANEIVIPIAIMGYLATGSITELSSTTELYNLFSANGWTWVTALCVMLFSLMHFPCATTCLTIKKETNSLKWTVVSILLPTVIGFAICFVVKGIAVMFALV